MQTHIWPTSLCAVGNNDNNLCKFLSSLATPIRFSLGIGGVLCAHRNRGRERAQGGPPSPHHEWQVTEDSLGCLELFRRQRRTILPNLHTLHFREVHLHFLCDSPHSAQVLSEPNVRATFPSLGFLLVGARTQVGKVSTMGCQLHLEGDSIPWFQVSINQSSYDASKASSYLAHLAAV